MTRYQAVAAQANDKAWVQSKSSAESVLSVERPARRLPRDLHNIARPGIHQIVSASTTICVSVPTEIPSTSWILSAWTCIGAPPIDEIICTDTFGVALKAGNLNSPCTTRFEVEGVSSTEAQYVNALDGAGLGSKYTAFARVFCPDAGAKLSSPEAVLDTWC